MAPPNREFEDRISFLEALVAALVAQDREFGRRLSDELMSDLGVSRRNPKFQYYLREIASSTRHDWMDSEIREVLNRMNSRIEQQQDKINSADMQLGRFMSEAQESSRIHSAQMKLIQESVNSLQTEQELLSSDTYAFLSLQSLGIDLQQVRTTRFLPVRLYVTRESQDMAAPLIETVERMLEAYGFEVADDFPAERGSVWKRWFSRSKDALTSEEAQDIARKLKKGAEVAGLDKPMADVNKTQSEALRNALEIAKDYDDVALQFGTALVVVRTNSNSERKTAMAITLSPAQVIALENNPDLLHNPATVLERLRELCEADGTESQEVLDHREQQCHRTLKDPNQGYE